MSVGRLNVVGRGVGVGLVVAVAVATAAVDAVGAWLGTPCEAITGDGAVRHPTGVAAHPAASAAMSAHAASDHER